MAEPRSNGNWFVDLFEGATNVLADSIDPQSGTIDPLALVFKPVRESYRAEREWQRKGRELAMQRAAREEQDAILGQIKGIADLFGGAPTDTQQAGLRQALVGAGVDDATLAPLARGATETRRKGRQAGRAAGLAPEVARIADVNAAQAAGQTAFSQQEQRATNVQQAGLTRGNEAFRVGLENQQMLAREAEQFQRGKQLEKAKTRIGRREERSKARPFVDASRQLLEFSQTPEGQAAFEKNPALRGVLGIMQATQGAGLSPEVAQEMFSAATGAAQKGATAQGTPDQFAPSTKGLVEKDLLAAQDLGMLADRVIATYNPNWSTISGKAQLTSEKVGDFAGYTTQNLAEFRSWNQGASELYSRNKLELTGQASNAQESREIERVVPNPDSLGPTQILAALQSYRANAARKERMLAKIAAQGRVELSQPEKDALTLQTLKDLQRQGVVPEFAVKNFFAMMAPQRRQQAIMEIQKQAMEASGGPAQ